MERHEVIILGAGLTGLSTAYHLGGDYLLIEREDRPGGLTRTEAIDDFLFDYTGHWLHLRDPIAQGLVLELLQGRLLTISRRAKIYSNGVFTDYPFQANLYGLPSQVLRECLHGAIEAALRRACSKRPPRLRTFLDYVLYHFGEGIAKHFIVPYNTKLWGVGPQEVTAEWTQRFVPVPDIYEIADGAIGLSRQALGYNATFLYPAEGGIEALAKAFISRLDRDRIILNAEVTEINVSQRYVSVGSRRFHYDYLVSTLPLPELVARTSDAPAQIRRASSLLRCSPLHYMNVGLRVEQPLNGAHWVYLPEPRIPFYRIGSASNAVPYLAPKGMGSLYVEVANDRSLSERDLVHALAAFLKEIGTVRRDADVLFVVFREHRYGYVIYDQNCKRAREKVLSYFRERGVFSVGRYGAWTYNSMEDAIIAGRDTAHALRAM